MCVSACGYIQESASTKSPEAKSIGSPGPGVTGSCEPLDVSAGKGPSSGRKHACNTESSLQPPFSSFIFIYACIGTHTTACTWRPQNNSQGSFLSCHMGSGDQIQVVRCISHQGSLEEQN